MILSVDSVRLLGCSFQINVHYMTTWPSFTVRVHSFDFSELPHVEELVSLVETPETSELLVLVVLVVVVEINSCTTSAPAPSTADRFPVTLTDKLVSPKALEACRVNRSKMVQDMERGAIVLKMLKWLGISKI